MSRPVAPMNTGMPFPAAVPLPFLEPDFTGGVKYHAEGQLGFEGFFLCATSVQLCATSVGSHVTPVFLRLDQQHQQQASEHAKLGGSLGASFGLGKSWCLSKLFSL